MDVEPSWRPYLRLQKQSRRHTRVDALAWGIESALDELLNTISSKDPDNMTIEAEKAVARGKARERHRLRLRLRYFDPREVDDPADRLNDRARLRETFDRISETDAKILLGIGFGHDSRTVADQVSIRPVTMRKRLDRLRMKLAA